MSFLTSYTMILLNILADVTLKIPKWKHRYTGYGSTNNQ